MKIFISADIEGVAGVGESAQGQRGAAEYPLACQLMTEEANAAIRGAFAGGATEVLVADSHGPMRNMPPDALDPRARLIQGTPRPLSMIQGLTSDFAGVVLIGYHAAAANFGTLAHTINGFSFARIEVNGVLAGEPTLFAGYAAEQGVPLLAVSGDDRLAAEIEVQFPHARRITVKSSIGVVVTNSLSPMRSRELIENEVRAAVKAAAEAPVEAPCKAPLTVRLQFTRQLFADAAAMLPWLTRLDSTTVEFTVKDHGEAIGALSALSLISGSFR